MNKLMQQIQRIETTLATETDHFKRWCQRKELRKILKRLDSMAK